MATYSQPEDVVNAALAEIGWERRVADLYEGSRAARLALQVYGQVRDQVLASRDWHFARARAELATPLKTRISAYGAAWLPASEPPPPWLYEYAVPADLIRPLAIMEMPTWPGVQYDPRAALWELADDTLIDAQTGANGSRVILANLKPAVLVYTSRILDPTQWDALFTASLILSLGRPLMAALGKAPAQPAQAG